MPSYCLRLRRNEGEGSNLHRLRHPGGGIVRLRACMVGEVEVLARYALSGL